MLHKGKGQENLNMASLHLHQPPPLNNDPFDREYLLLLVFQLKDIFYLLPGVASTCDGRFSVERISSINTDMYSDKQCNVL